MRAMIVFLPTVDDIRQLAFRVAAFLERMKIGAASLAAEIVPRREHECCTCLILFPHLCGYLSSYISKILLKMDLNIQKSSTTKRKLKQSIYLINHTKDKLSGARLPSNLEVLRLLIYHLRAKPGKGSRTKAYSVTAQQVMQVWGKARIPTRSKGCIVTQLKNVYDEWRSLQKTAKRRDSTQITREAAFQNRFDDLFDIAPVDAMTRIKNQEDRQFLML